MNNHTFLVSSEFVYVYVESWLYFSGLSTFSCLLLVLLKERPEKNRECFLIESWRRSERILWQFLSHHIFLVRRVRQLLQGRISHEFWK
jgi:hypothetical protein